VPGEPPWGARKQVEKIRPGKSQNHPIQNVRGEMGEKAQKKKIKTKNYKNG